MGRRLRADKRGAIVSQRPKLLNDLYMTYFLNYAKTYHTKMNKAKQYVATYKTETGSHIANFSILYTKYWYFIFKYKK